MTSMNSFAGWARAASAEGMSRMPAFVEAAVHKDCEDPDFRWSELLLLYTQRREIAMGKLRPEDVMGVGASHDEVESYIERSIDWHAGCLAWGDFS